ncbi:MAG: hypothetical protein E7345_04605 [Clostridiales bacterium]|nr:hypothetical protein [Clostridiales bacterium]
MDYKLERKDGLYYFCDENGKMHGEGYLQAEEFKNGIARVKKQDGLMYCINENFVTTSPGYDYVYTKDYGYFGGVTNKGGTASEEVLLDSKGKKMHDGSFNDIEVYRMGRYEFYLIEQPEGDFYIADSNFNRLTKHKEYESKWEVVKEQLDPIKKYLEGQEDVYDLPDKCFEGFKLDVILDNEKKQYEYLIRMTHTEEQRNQVRQDCVAKADYVKSKALDMYNNNEQDKFLDMDLF